MVSTPEHADPQSLRALLRMAARLNDHRDIDDLSQLICEELAGAFGTPVATIAMPDADGIFLRTTATVGLTREQRERLAPYPIERWLRYVEQFGDAFVVPDLQAHGEGNSGVQRELDMRSSAVATLRHHGEALGLITVTVRGAHRVFTDGELELLRGMAVLAAQALQNAKLFAENDAQLRALRALYTGVHRLVADLDLDGVARSITQACIDSLGVTLAWIGIAESDGSVTPITHAPPEATYPYSIKVRWDEGPSAQGPTGRAIRGRVPAKATDLDGDPNFAPWSEIARNAGLRSSLALPLVSRNKVLGALNLYSDTVQFFSPAREQFCRAFADLAAAALDNARSAIERRDMEQKLVFAERMASLGTLAAGVAHEINNPLAFVMMNVELAIERPGRTRAEPAVRALLEDARLGSQRVRDIVRDLKRFARHDEDRREPVDVRRVVEFALDMASAELASRARVAREFEDVPAVLGSESRLGQVFVNLIVNAAQSITPGRSEQNEVRVVLKRDGPFVAVEIHDTGCGIPSSNLGRVFDPFFTTKPIGVGTGLGLSICHGIVRDHGGEILVRSEVDRGSVFIVRLPATS